APKQPGARCQRLGEVVARSDRLENAYCLLNVFRGRAGIVTTKALPHQPTRQSLYIPVTRFTAFAESFDGQRSGTTNIAAKQGSLHEPQRPAQRGLAQPKVLEPGEGFGHLGNTGIKPPHLDLPVPPDRLRMRSVIRRGRERERLVATL